MNNTEQIKTQKLYTALKSWFKLGNGAAFRLSRSGKLFIWLSSCTLTFETCSNFSLYSFNIASVFTNSFCCQLMKFLIQEAAFFRSSISLDNRSLYSFSRSHASSTTLESLSAAWISFIVSNTAVSCTSGGNFEIFSRTGRSPETGIIKQQRKLHSVFRKCVLWGFNQISIKRTVAKWNNWEDRIQGTCTINWKSQRRSAALNHSLCHRWTGNSF